MGMNPLSPQRIIVKVCVTGPYIAMVRFFKISNKWCVLIAWCVRVCESECVCLAGSHFLRAL